MDRKKSAYRGSGVRSPARVNGYVSELYPFTLTEDLVYISFLSNFYSFGVKASRQILDSFKTIEVWSLTSVGPRFGPISYIQVMR